MLERIPFRGVLAMIERRTHPRIPTEEPARVLLNSHFVLACTIRNISLGGACLELDGGVAIPEVFDLIPTQSDARTCRVMWRAKDRVGVAFQH
jgi:PilZ domain